MVGAVSDYARDECPRQVLLYPSGASVPAGAEQEFSLHSHESGGIWQIPSLLTQPTHHQEVGPDLFLLGRVGQHEGLGKGEIVVTLGATMPPLV